MSLKEEFIALARLPGSNKRELCRRFGISPQTAYKWLGRYEALGQAGLEDRSRKPATSPKLTDSELQAQVIALRKAHPAWGGRTISNVLNKQIAPSTVTSVLHRHGLIEPAAKEHEAKLRFEHDAPNDLWQMDFKGHFATQQGRCHPLTMLDDHSRFNLAIQACDNERGPTVKEKMIEIERFHRSFKAEVLDGHLFSTFKEAQSAFDRWRDVYNLQRPHQALENKVPMQRYRTSPWAYPKVLAEFEYGQDDVLAKVYSSRFRFRKRYFSIAKGLLGKHVAIRPSVRGESMFDVYFCHHLLRTIDIDQPDYT
nr:hypothetical protein [Tanacetum cinerariifolium]